jgi:hypothetical protein
MRVTKTSNKSWRDVQPVHPAAELFPLMSAAELCELGQDIKKNGLASPVALWQADHRSPLQLLDGRNRLDAIEMATGKPVEIGAPRLMAGEFLATDKVIVLDGKVDPYAYVVSANIHRRHLTAEQKREIIAKLLKADPTRSNRQIAETVNVDHKTVASVRAEKVATGEIPQLSRTIGRDGKARKRQPSRTKPTAATTSAPANLPPTRDEIGETSSGELARLQAYVAELEAAKRGLENENRALRCQLAELEQALAKAAPLAIKASTSLPSCGGCRHEQ